MFLVVNLAQNKYIFRLLYIYIYIIIEACMCKIKINENDKPLDIFGYDCVIMGFVWRARFLY